MQKSINLSRENHKSNASVILTLLKGKRFCIVQACKLLSPYLSNDGNKLKVVSRNLHFDQKYHNSGHVYTISLREQSPFINNKLSF